MPCRFKGVDSKCRIYEQRRCDLDFLGDHMGDHLANANNIIAFHLGSIYYFMQILYYRLNSQHTYSVTVLPYNFGIR
ncbi:hypothetical protein Mapa_009702 [Marchantia paleacea]|nr:hypothetical protein Mapa_009702 [Marchantia paleacea]